MRKFFYTILLTGFILLPEILFSAPIPPGPGGSTPAPIDGGIGFLIAAGIAYGTKRFFDRAKKN